VNRPLHGLFRRLSSDVTPAPIYLFCPARVQKSLVIITVPFSIDRDVRNFCRLAGGIAFQQLKKAKAKVGSSSVLQVEGLER
jgi:hypothetical protein